MPFPSKDHQFRRGEPSANPSGRPKAASVTSALKRLMAETEINGKPLPPGETVADMLARVIRKAAFEGDFQFMRLLLERTDGPVTQRIQVEDARKSYDVTTSPEKLWQEDKMTPGGTTKPTAPPSNSGNDPTKS